MKNIINTFQSFIENLVNIFTDFDNLINIVIGVILLILFILLRNKLSKLILNLVSKVLAAKKPDFVNPFKDALKKPL